MRAVARMLVAVVVLAVAVVSAPSAASADETRDEQWMLDALDLEKVHSEITKGAGTRIGLIDSGVDPNHPDLKGNVEKGLTTWKRGDGQEDTLGHGTAMASLLVGHGHGEGDKDGILGVAPEATVVPVAVYPSWYKEDPDSISSGKDVFKGVTEGLRWLVDEAEVDLIVLPFSYGFSSRTDDAVEYVAEKEVPMFAPTGNNQGTGDIGDDPSVQAPASLPGVEAVAGTNQDGKQWEGSNYGRETMFSAPAADIITAAPDGKYTTASGTSNAAAIAGGVAALMDSQWPDMDRGVIQWRLGKTATDVDDSGPDVRTGHGIINPYEALTATVDIPEELQEGDTEEEYNPEPNPRTSETAKDSASKTLTGDSSIPLWLIVAGVAVLAVVVVGLLVWMKRRKKTAEVAPPSSGYPPQDGFPPTS